MVILTDETEDLQPEIEDGLYKTSAWAKELSQVCHFLKLSITNVDPCPSRSRTKLNEPNVSRR